ncbi:hypothetical protein [Flavivirga aquatica]|uniref:hypothetical protein n=1 Tax=Flavivirga aquatica TaxID=1849968 RepID=UPI001F0A7D35|nr:hypothetical protein [Flavivirga aquatica]
MRAFNYISVTYDKDRELLLWKIKDRGMPNFFLSILKEFREFSIWVKEYFSIPDRPLKFIVSGSEHLGVYNMGGDLPYFLNCIKTNQKEKLKTFNFV